VNESIFSRSDFNESTKVHESNHRSVKYVAHIWNVGELLNPLTLTSAQAFKMGALLAQLHNIRTEFYGNLIDDVKTNTTPAQEMHSDIEESTINLIYFQVSCML